MNRNSQLLLIVFISTIQLAMTLLAVAWLFGWIDGKTQEFAAREAKQRQQFVATQVASRVSEMELGDITPGSSDWKRLQAYVESTRLPGRGYISVVHSQTDQIICHPRIAKNQEILGEVWLENRNAGDGQGLVDRVVKRKDHNPAAALFDSDGTLSVVYGQSLPQLNAVVLTHQPIVGGQFRNPVFLSSMRGFSFTVVLIIGLLGTVLNIFVVKRIVDHDARVQGSMERLVADRTDELVRTKNATIFGLAKLAESRDNDTGEHLDRIRKYVTILASDLSEVYEEIDAEFIKNLGIASSLHDIGKVGIPDSILLKPGRLTTLERSIMEKHTIIGGECLDAIGAKLGDNDFLEMAREVAYWHHEHWDGGGYPHRLSDEQIPISARIVAVADVYDALTSRRPYKRGMPHSESRAIILSGAGQQFDPEVVAAFLRHEAQFKQVARRYQNVDFEKPLVTASSAYDHDAELTEVV